MTRSYKRIVLGFMAFLAFTSMACMPMYDARWRNAPEAIPRPGNGDAPVDIPIDDPVNPAEDPFAKINNYAEHFDSALFDTWALRIEVDSANIPNYWFTNGTWSAKDIEKNEYTCSGPNSTAGGHLLRDLVYFQYRSKHPLMLASGAYNTGNHGKRMERFYFYRFTGKTPSPELDNHLFAIDRCTKLVFIYARPGRFDSVLGNKVPRDWEPFEKNNVNIKFYEYDPVGWVSSDGKIHKFDWFTDDLRNSSFDPRVHPEYTETAKPGIPGLSPYKPAKILQSPVSGTLRLEARTITNVSISGRNYHWSIHGKPVDEAYFLYDIRARIYAETPAPFTRLAACNNGAFLQDTWLVREVYKIHYIKTGTEDLCKDASAVSKAVNDETTDLFFDIDARLVKYDHGHEGAARSRFDIADYSTPIISFKYDRAKQAWCLKGANGSYKGSTKCRYDEAFELKIGETKSFTLTYASEIGDIKLSYMLSWN